MHKLVIENPSTSLFLHKHKKPSMNQEAKSFSTTTREKLSWSGWLWQVPHFAAFWKPVTSCHHLYNWINCFFLMECIECICNTPRSKVYSGRGLLSICDTEDPSSAQRGIKTHISWLGLSGFKPFLQPNPTHCLTQSSISLQCMNCIRKRNASWQAASLPATSWK